MTRLLLNTLLATTGFLCVGAEASATDCDFSKPAGTCRGKITIDSTSGSKPSYSAEYTITSSAATCSKVEYYIDNTPHQTVLKGRNSDQDSTFGTSPITKRDFKVKKCTAYVDRDADGGKGDVGKSSAKAGPAFFGGHWSGRVSMLLFSSSMTLTIAVNGTHASGRSVGDNDSIEFDNGSINGGKLTYSFREPEGDSIVNVTLTRISDNTIRYSGGFSGTLTRQ
jgi:hypothetical protein